MNFQKSISAFIGATMCAFSLNAAAAPVSVNFSADISYIDDQAGVLADLNITSIITGNYNYDDSEPDQDANPSVGFYPLGMVGGMQVNLGNAQLSTIPGGILDIFINDEAWMPGEEHYDVNASMFKINNGIEIQQVILHLRGMTGEGLTSDQLAAPLPDLSKFNENRSLIIHGSRYGKNFFIDAVISQLSAAEEGNKTAFSYKADVQLDWIDDYSGALAGRANLGDIVTVYYGLDSSTVDNDPSSEYGFYPHSGSYPMMTVELADGSIVESGTMMDAMVSNSAGWDGFSVYSPENVIGSSTNSTASISLDFHGSNTVLSSDQLLTDVIPVTHWHGAFSNVMSGSEGWSFSGNVINVEKISGEPIAVVPGDAVIHPAQKFDAAFYVVGHEPIIGIGGSLNGNPEDGYFASCNVFHDSAMNQVVICPQINDLLMPDVNQVKVRFDLIDGTSVTASVVWTVN